MVLDTLEVNVLEARSLAAMNNSGTSDVYCTLRSTFNTQKFKSKVAKKTLSPIFQQKFSFYTTVPDGYILLQLWNHNTIFKDELMGEVQVSLADAASGALIDKWYPVQNEPSKRKVNETQGEMHLKVQFTGPGGPLSSSASLSESTDNAAIASNSTSEKKEEDTKDEHAAAAATASSSSSSSSAAAATASSSSADKDKGDKPKKKKEGPVRIEDKYDIGKDIGRGAFSVVKLATRKANGKKYAIKCISKKMIDKKELALLEREIDIMKKLQHPNIIQLMEVIDTPDTLFLVLEYAGGGELFDAIVNKGSYSEGEASHLIRQILEAIQYVHDHGIAHRDLKPENLLLSAEKEDFVKIADFGLSKDFGQEALQTSCGTPDYVAPEVLLGEQYDMGVDIWSIGVIMYVLLCGFPPFYGETQKELFESIMGGNFDFPDPEWTSVSEEAKDLIKKILVVDPEKRLTAEQCLNHPWLRTDDGKKKKEMKRLNTQAKFKAYNEKYKKEHGKADAEVH